MNDVPVNDGGGLYDNAGLCDTLIIDCNNLCKHALNGNYVQACALVVSMVQRLANLRDGIRRDIDSKNKSIEELKRLNDDLVRQQTGLPVEGVDDGNG